MKKFIFIGLMIFFYNLVFPQLTPTGNEKRIDSLLKYIKKETNDTNQVNILNELGFEYSITNFLQAKYYLNQAEKLARRINFKRGIANSLCNLGIAYETQGDYFEALNAQILALKIREEIGDKSGISYSIHYIGDVYFGQGDLSDRASVKEDYNKKAMEQYFKSLKIAEEIGDKKSIANTYNCIGNSLREKGEMDSALHYYIKTVDLREQIGDKINLSTTFVNIGKLYLKQNDYSNALEYLFKALEIAEKLGHKRTIVKSLGTIGTTYFMQKKYDEALEFSQRSLQTGRKIGYLEYIAKANKLLSQIYSDDNFSGHNSDKALYHYQRYIMEKDSIDTKKASQVALQYEFEKKEELAKAEYAKQMAISEEEKKKQKIIIWSVAGGLLFVIVFALLIYRSLQTTQKQKLIIEQKEKETQGQKKEIEHKQKEILDSISYAQHLQEAILPSIDFISKNLTDNFILYKPKDIVAGDFYWAEKVDDSFFIAAADSTGHGVPGALVSVVCSNALNRSLKEFKLTETGKILDKSRELVLETFEKSSSEVKDGMDISLISIDLKNKKIFWSGANNPLWYIQNEELKEIKADKQPIGKTENPQPFTTHQIEFKENITFYLFTDGLADQFGGPNGKKFKYKQFSEILLKNNMLSQKQQAEMINKTFENWKGNLEQVDDVCVIGIKI